MQNLLVVLLLLVMVMLMMEEWMLGERRNEKGVGVSHLLVLAVKREKGGDEKSQGVYYWYLLVQEEWKIDQDRGGVQYW